MKIKNMKSTGGLLLAVSAAALMGCGGGSSKSDSAPANPPAEEEEKKEDNKIADEDILKVTGDATGLEDIVGQWASECDTRVEDDVADSYKGQLSLKSDGQFKLSVTKFYDPDCVAENKMATYSVYGGFSGGAAASDPADAKIIDFKVAKSTIALSAESAEELSTGRGKRQKICGLSAAAGQVWKAEEEVEVTGLKCYGEDREQANIKVNPKAEDTLHDIYRVVNGELQVGLDPYVETELDGSSPEKRPKTWASTKYKKSE